MTNLFLGIFIGIVIGWLLCLWSIVFSGHAIEKEVANGRRYETLNRTEALCLLSVVPEDVWEEVKKR